MGFTLEKFPDKWVIYQFTLFALILLSTLSVHSRHTTCVIILGTALFTLGVITLIISYNKLGSSFTPAAKPTEGAALVTDGIYGLVRHPMYTGLLLCAFGWSIAWGNWLGLLLSLVLILVLDGKSRLEEQYLQEKYPEYSAYKTRTKKFFPFVY